MSDVDDAFDFVKGWEVTQVIQADGPPIYEIRSENFVFAKDGCIRVTAEELVSPDKLRLAFLNQDCFAIPFLSEETWLDCNGPYCFLVDGAKKQDPS